MARRRAFGISTHLYRGRRLTREHFAEIAAHGFDAVELVATRTEVDFHNPATVADVQAWLGDSGLTLASVHAPLGERWTGGHWSSPLSLGSADKEARARAVGEAERALQIARRIPFQTLIVHLGPPRWSSSAAADGNRDAARRSVEELQDIAGPLGVRVAVEVTQNELSRAGALVHFIEHVVDATGVGICLDLGHARLDGDLLDAVETVSEYLVAVDVHDTRGRTDDHLVPFDGVIDWPSVLTSVQKIGYEGPFMFELAAAGSPKDTLQRARTARAKMERLLAD